MKNYTEKDSFGTKFPENITKFIEEAATAFSKDNYGHVKPSTTFYGSVPITLNFEKESIFNYVIPEACHHASQNILNRKNMKYEVLFNFIFPTAEAITGSVGYDKDYYDKVIYLYETFVMNEKTSPWKDILKYFRLEVRGKYSFQVMYCEDNNYLSDYEYALCMNFLIFSRMFSEHGCGAVVYELVTKYNIPFEPAVIMAESAGRSFHLTDLPSKSFNIARTTGHGPFNGGFTFYRWLFGLGPNKDIKISRPTLYTSEALWGTKGNLKIPNILTTNKGDYIRSSQNKVLGSLSGFFYTIPQELFECDNSFLDSIFESKDNNIQKSLNIYHYFKKVAEDQMKQLGGKKELT